MTEFEVFFNSRVLDYRKKAAELQASFVKHVVLLGDSITEGFPAQTLCDGKWTVFNQGISGDMINRPDGGLLRRLSIVTASQPAWVFLLIGVNDLIFGDHDVPRMKRELPQIIQTLSKANPATKLCIQTIMPTFGEFLYVLPDILDMNKLIFTNYKAWGATELLDTYSIMADKETGAYVPELTYDGLHLSPKGYECWVATLEEFLTQKAK